MTHLVDIWNDLDGLAGDEEDRDGDEDDAEVGLAPLPRSHLGIRVRVFTHALKDCKDVECRVENIEFLMPCPSGTLY